MDRARQAIAGANIHIGIMPGKLKGVMPAPMPTGWRMEYMSMAGPAPSVNSPLERCGMPHTNSQTSRPRMMSPFESSTVLPCSADSISASSSMFWFRRSTNLKNTRARRCGFVAAHFGCAALAFSTAARSSASLARATVACTSPVAGLKTFAVRPLVPATCLPPIK
jgi:hypothetical protein